MNQVGNRQTVEGTSMLIIGSHAMKYYFANARLPGRDMDVICTIEEFEEDVAKTNNVAVYPTNGSHMVKKTVDGFIVEYEIAWPGTTAAEILQIMDDDFAHPEIQLLLKLSHRYKKNSPHFLKTMRDIQFLRSKGVVLSEELTALLKRREKETYTYAHPKLNQNKQQFFKESDSFYKYEHDDIHAAVAVEESPAYTKFSEDGEEVHVSRSKWNSLPLRTKLLAGLEESYVLAIERSLVPHTGVLTPKQAFDKALEKVCTSITSGWFREFCWENYDKIQELYDESYVDRFNYALVNGQIREFNAT